VPDRTQQSGGQITFSAEAPQQHSSLVPAKQTDAPGMSTPMTSTARRISARAITRRG
jgi:hypothetical protein